ncbi:hypothetical protein [Saccharothrix variisporea]|nr:hypothetical protein [Saccharothrix variisporea]
MLAPLRDARDEVIAEFTRTKHDIAWATLFELSVVPYGIADVVHVAVDQEVVEERRALGASPITDHHELTLFMILQHSRHDGYRAREIAVRAGMSVEGLRRGPLARLTAAGHVERLSGHIYRPTWRYRTAICALVAIEVKRTDWRRAAQQALRYTTFADRTYLALESATAQRALLHPELIATTRVGLIQVEPSTLRVKKIKNAPSPGDRLRKFERLRAAEAAFLLIDSGKVSGPILPVFGKTHTTSTGVDPRSLS